MNVLGGSACVVAGPPIVARVVGKVPQGGHHSGTGLAGDWCVSSCCVGWCMHVEVAYGLVGTTACSYCRQNMQGARGVVQWRHHPSTGLAGSGAVRVGDDSCALMSVAGQRLMALLWTWWQMQYGDSRAYGWLASAGCDDGGICVSARPQRTCVDGLAAIL